MIKRLCNVCGDPMPLDNDPGALAVKPDTKPRQDFCASCATPIIRLVEQLLAAGRQARALRSISQRARDLNLAEHFATRPQDPHGTLLHPRQGCVPQAAVVAAEPAQPGDEHARRPAKRTVRTVRDVLGYPAKRS